MSDAVHVFGLRLVTIRREIISASVAMQLTFDVRPVQVVSIVPKTCHCFTDLAVGSYPGPHSSVQPTTSHRFA